jgi:hypothetical protein
MAQHIRLLEFALQQTFTSLSLDDILMKFKREKNI